VVLALALQRQNRRWQFNWQWSSPLLDDKTRLKGSCCSVGEEVLVTVLTLLHHFWASSFLA
jgi:hypothetical protein